MITAYEVLREKALKKEYEETVREKQLLLSEEYVRLEQEHAEYSRRYMFGGESDNKSLQQKISETEARMRELRSKNSNCSVCPKCMDRGVTNGTICDCTLPEIYIRCFGAEDVKSFSESFDKSDLRKFDDSEKVVVNRTQREAYKIVWTETKKYAESFPHGKIKNLFLTGGTGLGKSFLCRCIAVSVSEKAPVLFISASQLFRVFLEHRLGAAVELELLWDAPMMIIDDLGSEPLYQNVSVEYLSELVEKRQSKQKYTVISSNLPIEGLKDRYGERVSSRIGFRDIGMQIEFHGRDIRNK